MPPANLGLNNSYLAEAPTWQSGLPGTAPLGYTSVGTHDPKCRSDAA